MKLLWKMLDFLPNLNIVDYVLIGALALLSLLLIGAGLFAFVKDKPMKTILLTGLGGVSLFFAFLFGKKINQDNSELQKKIEELKKKEKELLAEMAKLDKEVKEEYEEYKKLLKEKENIEKDLQAKLEAAQSIVPKPIQTDQDVDDAFDFAANYPNKKKKKIKKRSRL